MRKLRIFLIAICLYVAVACSPRDFLTRRLAADLIAGSEAFGTTQQFWLRTGVISGSDYASPEYLLLQHRGWITGAAVPCSPGPGQHIRNNAPAACWDVALTPLGVETFRDLIPKNAAVSQYLNVPVARRELVAVTGISKGGNFADVEFRWKWTPLNEVGAALFAGGVQYNSTVAFRHYDDGWRVIEGNSPKSNQNLDDALKNAETAP